MKRASLRSRLLVRLLFGSLLFGASAANVYPTTGCKSLGDCNASATQRIVPDEHSALRLAARIEYLELIGGEARADGHALTPKEYSAFGGIGAIVCRHGQQRRTSTAFLVGRFDVAVTVAHVFADHGRWIAPGHCFYKSAGPAGEVRERIAVASIKAQWQLEPETFGRAASDLAVVRLQAPVRFARRTLSLTKFAYKHAPVILVGYPSDIGAALRRKSPGHVYRYWNGTCTPFAHDVDSRNIAAGAPLIDQRDHVVIGIHTRLGARFANQSGCKRRGNAMIVMNEWLERTLRAEIAAGPAGLELE